jgi:hypothetical protein
MATFIKINDWIKNMANGTVDVDGDTFRVALSNTAPASEASNPTSSGNGVLANVTQISYTNYTDSLTVDRQLQSVTSAESGGTYTFDAADFTITASGGALATWRYLYVYDDTSTAPADALVAVWDQGSAISLASGETININWNASGLFTVA